MDIIRKAKSHGKKMAAAVFSVGVGVSAAAGFAFLDDASDMNENPDLIDNRDEQVNDIDSQIDENKQRLNTVAESTENDIKYTRLSC